MQENLKRSTLSSRRESQRAENQGRINPIRIIGTQRERLAYRVDRGGIEEIRRG